MTMEGGEVALAALTILGTAVGFLGWVIKYLFTQNTAAFEKLSGSIDKLEKTIDKKDEANEEFQSKVCLILDKISLKQDEIHETVNTINATNMNVETIVVKKFGECKEEKKNAK